MPGAAAAAAADAPLLVVVSGPPGAGKSSIARAVAERLALPLAGKDAVKEALHDALGGEERVPADALEAATAATLLRLAHELLAGGRALVVEGDFRTAGPFRELPRARILQVYVHAPPEVLRERFADRERHPVHAEPEAADEVRACAAAGEWRRLDHAGDTVDVDTTRFPDPAAVADEVARRLSSA